jgi:site-specific DNA recombinase
LKIKKLSAIIGSKAVAYIRVSSDEQAEAGVSLDAQAAKLMAYGQVRGFELVDVISDPAVSGHTPLGERPGGRRLLALVDAGAVEHVLAVKLDRLFRNALRTGQLITVACCGMAR